MQSDFMLVTAVALPPQSAITCLYKSVDFADAFAIQLRSTASNDPDVLARFLLSNQPSWIGVLTKVRDAIVACFGLKTSGYLASLPSDTGARRISFFKVYSTSKTEIVAKIEAAIRG